MDINLDHIENLLTHECFCGKNREVYYPVVEQYITENIFKDTKNRFILETIKQFHLDNGKLPNKRELFLFLDTQEKVKMFRDFFEVVKEYKSKTIPDDTLLKYTEEFLRQRIIKSVLIEAQFKDSHGEEVDIKDMYDQIGDAMSIYLQDDLGLALFGGSEEYMEYLESNDSFISTGFKWLDMQLGGGLRSAGGDMYNLCAPTNVGKSNMLKSIACNLSLQGKNVLVISLEMRRYAYADRFISELSGLGISTLKHNKESVESFLQTNGSEFGEVVIKDFAIGSVTTQQVSSYIKRAEAHYGFKFDAIFVDYPELFKPTRRAERHDITVGNLYIETRALSFFHEAPIVVVSQLNKEAFKSDDTIPNITNIQNSMAVIQCSDYVGLMYANDQMKEVNQIGFKTGKSRFYRVNEVQIFDVCPKTLKITEALGDATQIGNLDSDIDDEEDSIF